MKSGRLARQKWPIWVKKLPIRIRKVADSGKKWPIRLTKLPIRIRKVADSCKHITKWQL